MKKTPTWKRKGIIAAFLIVALIVVSGILAFHLIREAPPEIPTGEMIHPGGMIIPPISFSPTYPVSLENYSYILSNENDWETLDMVRVELMNHSDMDISGTLTGYIFHRWMAPMGGPFFASPEIFSKGELLVITIPARSTGSHVIDIEGVPFQWIAENRSVLEITFNWELRYLYIWPLHPVG